MGLNLCVLIVLPLFFPLLLQVLLQLILLLVLSFRRSISAASHILCLCTVSGVVHIHQVGPRAWTDRW